MHIISSFLLGFCGFESYNQFAAGNQFYGYGYMVVAVVALITLVIDLVNTYNRGH